MTKKIIIICGSCGNQFEGHHHAQKYCSPECLKAGDKPFTHCILCGTKFRMRWGNNKYCSRECHKKAQRNGDYRATNIKEKIVCTHCGIEKESKEFKPKGRICNECLIKQSKQSRLNKIQYYKDNPDEKRKCPGCSKEFKLSEFYTTVYCKACYSAKTKKEQNRYKVNRAPRKGYFKKCIKCFEVKEETDFYPLTNICKKCSAVDNQNARDRRYNKEGINKKCPICKEVKSLGDFYKTGYCKKCYKSDTRLKLNTRISTKINRSLRRFGCNKKGCTWEKLVGYTVEKLKKHLEKQFTPKMSWDNYGSYWHIDHIQPLSGFYFKSADDYDFKRAWAMSNLRPLSAKKNLSKGAKHIIPFQPIFRF